jgi:hypothetical protein
MNREAGLSKLGENQLEPDGSGIPENIGWIYWELSTPHWTQSAGKLETSATSYRGPYHVVS